MGKTIDRRRFIQGAAVAGGAAALSGRLIRPARAAMPSSTGIDHIVVVTMENRSFDHWLGWLPNADGLRSAKKRFPTKDGELIGNYHLTEPMGCGHPDPDHSYEGGRFQLNGGKLNNFAKGANDRFAVGYYEASDRPFMSQLALNYTTCDRYFCGIMAETYPNRFYTHSGATDRLHNSTVTCHLPTIWDQLNKAGGPTGRYYFSDVPFLALYGGTYIPDSAFFPQFIIDCAAGTLPNVSYIDPRFVDEGSGTSGDDHPHADIHAGDSWLASVFHAVATSPNWDRTVVIVTYDEWGGFYDHVLPPRVTASSAVDKDVINGKAMLGYRVPCIIASPWTVGDPKHPRVIHNLFDHTSILKFIESNFRLKPVQRRDASRLPTDPGNLATALRRGTGDPKVSKAIPPFLAPPVVMPCGELNPGPLAALTGSGPPALSHADSWPALLEVARGHGWSV